MSIVKKYVTAEVDGTFRPQLTSLIDVMTILLVFLIKSFSVEGNIITPTQDLELPLSTATLQPRPRCTIALTRREILGDGKVITTLDRVAASDSLLISPLFSWMRMQRSRTTDSVQAPAVMIQCDREVQFSYVKKVMYTCSKAGFVNYSVLVLQEE